MIEGGVGVILLAVVYFTLKANITANNPDLPSILFPFEMVGIIALYCFLLSLILPYVRTPKGKEINLKLHLHLSC